MFRIGVVERIDSKASAKGSEREGIQTRNGSSRRREVVEGGGERGLPKADG